MKPFILGLCGGSGAGKTTVTDTFAYLGAIILNCDKIYAEIIAPSNHNPCLDEIVQHFGSQALLPDGSLNRKYIASVIFSDDEKRKLINSITHKYVLDEVRKRIQQCSTQGNTVFVVDAPLLFESEFDKECDMTLAVIADNEVRVSRIMARDDSNREQALRRINSQISNECLTNKTDAVIENSDTLTELQAQVTEFYNKYMKGV